MKLIFFIFTTSFFALQGFSQDLKSVILNDTTELQEYSNGEKLKVNFRLNNKIITIRQKEKLLTDNPGIRQEFNIKNVDTGIIGEVNFISEEIKLKREFIKPAKLDITKTVTGKPFPDFTWTDIDGNIISQDQLHGKIIVFNFWHTSCVPCIAEMPLLNKVAGKYSSANVEFIAVSPADRAELIRFLTKKQFDYRQIPAVDTKNIISPFPGWPIHIIIDTEGLVKFFALGKQENIETKLADAIDKLLIKEP